MKPGCTLKRLIEYRNETGLFSGDVDNYVQKFLDGMSQGTSQSHYVQASDGRIVLAKNEPLAGGGWVSTHEDVTEQRHVEQERAAIRSHPRFVRLVRAHFAAGGERSAGLQASANVETAAAAADELSRSIGEISRQLTQTSKPMRRGQPTMKSQVS